MESGNCTLLYMDFPRHKHLNVQVGDTRLRVENFRCVPNALQFSRRIGSIQRNNQTNVAGMILLRDETIQTCSEKFSLRETGLDEGGDPDTRNGFIGIIHWATAKENGMQVNQALPIESNLVQGENNQLAMPTTPSTHETDTFASCDGRHPRDRRFLPFSVSSKAELTLIAQKPQLDLDVN